MRGSHEAEAVIAIRAENEASEELADIRDQTQEAEKGFAGLSRGMITAGLGFLGLSFGAKEAVETFQEVRTSAGQVEFTLSLLGDAAKQAHDDMKPEFKGIAQAVNATEREVSEAFAIIIANTGGVAPSIAELIGVFNLATAAGISFKEAAALIGQGVGGILEPLIQLLDPSGKRGLRSLPDVLDKAADSAEKIRTPIDEFTAALRGLRDELAGDPVGLVAQSFEDIGTEAGNALKPVQTLFDALVDFASRTFGFAISENLGNEMEDVLERLQETARGEPLPPVLQGPPPLGGFGSGIVGLRGIGEPVQQLVFNIGSIDSESRLNALVRQIENILRNNNRNGTNVSDQ